MGHTAVYAADHDGLEAHLLRAVAEHPVLQIGGDLLLRHAGLDEIQGILQRLLSDALGSHHAVDLPRLLRASQLHNQFCRGDQLPARQLVLPAVVLGHRGVLLLEAQLFHIVGLENLVDNGFCGDLCGTLTDFCAGDVLPGRLDIAAVGDKVALLPGNDRCTGGGVELRGVKSIGLAGHHHCIQAKGVQFFGDFVESAHDCLLPAIHLEGRCRAWST